MKNRMTRYFVTAAGMLTLAGAPALFRERADLHRDYVERNARLRDIHRDRRWR